MKVLGVLALLAVIGQGVLGGLPGPAQLDARWPPSTAAPAQAFFALMVALCVLTGRAWAEAGPAGRRRRRTCGDGRPSTLALIYVQIVAGAWLRHFGTPAAWSSTPLLAAAVWGHAAMLAWRVVRHRAEAAGAWSPRPGRWRWR